MYTFKQNMSKEVGVAWWPEATIQRCKLRAARMVRVCREQIRNLDFLLPYDVYCHVQIPPMFSSFRAKPEGVLYSRFIAHTENVILRTELTQ